MSKIEKAYAITDAKISFVSLVDKAANKKQFLITKLRLFCFLRPNRQRGC